MIEGTSCVCKFIYFYADVNDFVTGGSSRDPQLLEMDETTPQKQEQMAMQSERQLQELEEREQDIRKLEVTLFLL